MKCEQCKGTGKVESKQRTLSQNNALHLFFKLLSDELNTKGLDARAILSESYEVWWTPEMVKTHIWRPFQKAKYGTESTKDLKKTEGQIENIHSDIMFRLGEKFHIDYIDFPSRCEKCGHLDCVCV